jgi:flavin reductase (DIM6/NTAB) family NADH-FMN oxidoreductase RutF
MPITQDEFRAALSRFPSGVTVVTTRDTEGRLHGITVSAFCSVSLEPPLVLVCIEKTTGSHDALAMSGSFVVNILAKGQQDVSEHFASLSPDKFVELRYHVGASGLPVLEDVAVSLECRLTEAYPAGDHTVFLGLVESVTIHDAEPIVYFHGEYHSICK